MVREYVTTMLNSENKYVSATQSIYDWCGEMQLWNDLDGNAENTRAEKTIFQYLLNTGVGKMDIAMDQIEESSMNFDTALGKHWDRNAPVY